MKHIILANTKIAIFTLVITEPSAPRELRRCNPSINKVTRAHLIKLLLCQTLNRLCSKRTHSFWKFRKYILYTYSEVKWNTTIVTSLIWDTLSTPRRNITYLAICAIPLCGIGILTVILKQSVVEPVVHGLRLKILVVQIEQTLFAILFCRTIFQLASPIRGIYGAGHSKMRAELEIQTVERRIQLRTDMTDKIRIENKALSQQSPRWMHWKIFIRYQISYKIVFKQAPRQSEIHARNDFGASQAKTVRWGCASGVCGGDPIVFGLAVECSCVVGQVVRSTRLRYYLSRKHDFG